MLGVYGDAGSLASIGVIGAFPMARRRALLDELAPYVTTFDGHPWDWAAHEQYAEATPAQRRAWGSRWNAGKDLSFVPLRPELVVETKYDYLEGGRLRHTGQFVRWRPDRDPRSCTWDQFERPVTYDLADLLGPS
jgi:ATP-dependent DNA ligase